MKAAGHVSWQALATAAGVSVYQVRRLRQGQIDQMRLGTLGQLARSLQVSTIELIQAVAPSQGPASNPANSSSQEITQLKQEYERLQIQLEEARASGQLEFQQASLYVLEPWLKQWYAAVDKAHKKPDMPAKNLVPLLRPLEKLLEQWGVVQIAPLGEEVSYDPRWHHLEKGTGVAGDRVVVLTPGFRHGPNLLHRSLVARV